MHAFVPKHKHVFEVPNDMSALAKGNFTTRYAGDTEARRKEEEKINHRGHRGRREEKKFTI
jgi:hypothetical protein